MVFSYLSQAQVQQGQILLIGYALLEPGTQSLGFELRRKDDVTAKPTCLGWRELGGELGSR